MINKIIRQGSVDKVATLIDDCDNVVITAHIAPDGDAVGSSLALFHFLMSLEKNVNIVLPDAIPPILSFLRDAKEIVSHADTPEYAEELLSKAQLIFCLDFNTPERIGKMKTPLMGSSAKKVLIDHHPNPAPFCDITISHNEISSTSELIFRLICRMGMYDEVNIDFAEAIYVGMMTDTGNFTYNSNSENIYIIISELLRKGIDKDALYNKVFNTTTADRIRLNGYALSQKMILSPSGRVAAIVLSQEELNSFHYIKGDTEGLVNVPLGIKEVVVSALIKEDSQQIKLSLRSQGEVAVNSIASAHFNGGGHRNAAGGEFCGTLDQAVALFMEATKNI